MGAEIGDSVSVDGHAGEVVGFEGGRVIVRPFPIAEQETSPGKPDCFVAQGDASVIKKHFERTASFDHERAQLAARVQATRDAIRTELYDAAARADRAWYRERER